MESLRITGQCLFLILLTSVIFCDVPKDEQEGYYAFEEAPSRYMRPPQVRKPPYMRSSVPCSNGEAPYNKRPSPKYTLCGDLNKGFIPMNPIGQDFNGEPYPFELIKNKTLVFLSKALPYLKEDPKIPKVTKIGVKKPASYNFLSPQDYRPHVHGHHKRKREAHDAAKNESAIFPTANYTEALQELLENQSTGRQNCDQGGASGLLCTLSSAMSNNKIPMALMTVMAQNLIESMKPTTPPPPSETPSASSHGQQYSNEHSDSGSNPSSMADAIVNLVSTLANMGLAAHGPGAVKDTTDEEPSTFAHVMSVLTGASPGSSSALSVILKLMASDTSPLKALAGSIPSRKRRPVEQDMAASETNVRRPQDNDFDLPPTPCPSSEEYVTPTFARNYQGVWKYVVQIPQEGYFTQTVQQTKCMKGRCDFMDGICHESPRWVSLLVAETYYPDSFFPTTSTAPPPPPPVEDFYNFQQYLKRRGGDDDEEDATFRHQPVFQERKPKPQQHCDGVDHIGCFVVRLYYDWFLVNGSCKCWKPSPKRILTGK